MEEMTIKDIAKMCGVGVSTVSRAINNHPDINPETKAMIMDVIEKHGYVPNNSARNLKRTDAKTIAVLVKGISNPFFSKMIKIIEKEIKKRKYSMVLHHVEFNEDEVDVASELIKEKRLKGIIFLGGYFIHSEEKLSTLSVPFILSTIDCLPGTEQSNTYSSVSVDDEAESYKVVDYLIRTGHKKIAMVGADPADESIGKLRFMGYKRALKDHGIAYNEELIGLMDKEAESYSLENGYKVTNRLLDGKAEFTAIYAVSDMLAIGAYKALFEHGKKIPDDYTVIGFDGIEMSEYITPSLTTLRQPIEEMAIETVQQLFFVLDGSKKHEHKTFPGELMIRESSRVIEE
jgi:LacI family transcriptional regulator